LDLSAPKLAEGLTYYVVLLFSLSFHESAHAWTASRMGDDTARNLGRISLNPVVHMDLIGTVLMPLVMIFGPGGIPFLAWAKPTPVDARNFKVGMFRRGQVLVAGAGPVSNLLLAVLFTVALYLAMRILTPSGPADAALNILAGGVVVNVGLAVFNLVPLPPLDGSWVASYGLPRDLGAAYDRVVRPYGGWILLILVMTGALGTVTSPIVRLLITWLYDLVRG
jgi:Zn-dependent protease